MARFLGSKVRGASIVRWGVIKRETELLIVWIDSSLETF